MTKILGLVYKNYTKYGLLFTVKDLTYRAYSLRYKLSLNNFGSNSVIYGNLHIINTGQIFVGEKVRFECQYRKSHMSSTKGGIIKIGNHVYINNGSIIESGKNNINIGNNVKIGPNVTIISEDHHGEEYGIQEKDNMNIDIKHMVWIGAGSIILPGVTIGEGTIVGAGSVVTKTLPKNSICVGNPCQKIRDIN